MKEALKLQLTNPVSEKTLRSSVNLGRTADLDDNISVGLSVGVTLFILHTVEILTIAALNYRMNVKSTV